MTQSPTQSEYWPLIAVLLACLLGALALADSVTGAMRYFMGLFFLLLALFKFFDLNGFAEGFARYDLIARAWRPYAYIYAFAELALGLAYLSQSVPMLTDAATLALMSVSAAGVIRSVASGEKLRCACMGTVLKVPLSTVSIVENAGMAAMAAAMLLLTF